MGDALVPAVRRDARRFYAWRRRPVSAHARQAEHLQVMRPMFEASHGTRTGVRGLHHALRLAGSGLHVR